MSYLRHNLDSFANGLKTLGIEHVVVSPGSRNAPIVAGFIRIGGFNMLSAPDERAAAFMALGSAQATGKPAVVICTSGTAVLNLYPGICEAYYQRIPLIAITADRPENLIDQWDGQTIHQKNIFEKHILRSFHLETDIHEQAAEESLLNIVSHATVISKSTPCGPVHINIPLAEPIYRDLDLAISPSYREVDLLTHPAVPDISIPEACLKAKKILFLAGHNKPDENLRHVLQSISKKFPVLTDVLSNSNSEETISCTENIEMLAEAHKPEVLISMGMGVVSKSLKSQLRKLNIPLHFHLGDGGFTGDPFFTKPITLHTNAADFLLKWLNSYQGLADSTFLQAWKKTCAEKPNIDTDTETEIVKNILKSIPKHACLQLGNSMTVRHANGCRTLPFTIFGNRGTSGIDGSVSTAMGYAWANPDKPVYCISGDIGFLYDKNAWWCNPLPKNILVIIINNRGGMIFDRLQGPEKLPELRKFVHTEHHFNAKAIAEHYGVGYNACNATELLRNRNDLRGYIENTFGILEIFTP